MLSNSFNTSRDVTPCAPPPSQPASKRTGKSLGVPVSQSRASEEGCSASPSPHVRREGADKDQDRLWDLSFGCFFFLTAWLEKQPAIMSREPEDVNKLTESAYKVSEIPKQIRS